jgi:hypothetical protein
MWECPVRRKEGENELVICCSSIVDGMWVHVFKSPGDLEHQAVIDAPTAPINQRSLHTLCEYDA